MMMKIKLTRKNQLWFLILLSSLTAVAQYVIQGSMASGENPIDFNKLFWYIDYFLWGIRSLIEAWVIIYLFSTKHNTQAEYIILTVMEMTLIVIITLTLGPALFALTIGDQIKNTMGETSLRLWTFGIAAYTSLMMASAGLAYKIQSNDDPDLINTVNQLKNDIEEKDNLINGNLTWIKIGEALKSQGYSVEELKKITKQLNGKIAWTLKGYNKGE